MPGQAVAAAERNVTGTEVARGLVRGVDPEIPILIHSRSRGAARRMATILTAAGFAVRVIPMAELTRERFLAWLETVRDVQRRRGPE